VLLLLLLLPLLLPLLLLLVYVHCRLLELTRICRPVAALSFHNQPQLREVATRLTQRWRRVATAAHDCASAALKAPMAAPKMAV
jgi:hypothetical protein